MFRKVSRVPLLPGACERIRDTPSQTQLPWKAREKNVRGAFACEANLSGKRIAMLDDVLTTGASLNELAKLLVAAGLPTCPPGCLRERCPMCFPLRAALALDMFD